MMICALLLTTMMSSKVFAANCDTIQQQLNVFATVNETKEWDMRQYFFTGENLKYSIVQDSAHFTVKDPLHEVSDPISHGDLSIGKIRAMKPLRSFETGAWLNDFIFLEQDNSTTDVFYSLSDPQLMDSVPSFANFLNARNQTSRFYCFDLDWITYTMIIVDCYQIVTNDEGETEIHNGFISLDIANSTFYNLSSNVHPTGYNYNRTDHRKIIFQNYTFILGENGEEILDWEFGKPLEQGFQSDIGQFLFRLEPAWATELADLSNNKLDDDCEIEVYQFSGTTLISDKPVAVLNKDSLGTAMGKTLTALTIIDFQIEPDGKMYVVDAKNGIYVVKITQSKSWTYIETITFPYLTPVIGFDFNYLLQLDGTYLKHLVLVFNTTANLYENGVHKLTIKLPATADYSTLQVQMSQKFLVLNLNENVYLYHSDDGKFLYQYVNTKLEYILINPYEPDLIGVNEVASYRFLLSNGFLKLINQQVAQIGTSSYTLKATTINNVADNCQVTVNVDVLLKNDTSIKLQSTHPFPDTLIVPADPIGIDLIASGPNLHYTSLLTLNDDRLGNSAIILEIKSAWNLNISGIKLPDAGQVIYSDILVLDDSTVFYLLLQIPTKIVYIYKCTHDLKYHEYAICQDHSSFVLAQQINKASHSFAWWFSYTYIYYYYQDTDYSFQIYSSYGDKTTNVGNIKPPQASGENKISSVTFTNNAIYIVIENTREVLVYSPFLPFSEIYVIDSAELSQFNIKGYFTPKRVFANKKVKAKIIFIQTNDYLYVGEFANANKVHSFVLNRQIPLTITGATVEVAIGVDHFFIVQMTDTQQVIEEYNYYHIQQIYKTKDLPLYHYTIQSPLTVDYSSQTGWLFVRATDGTETVILIYEPGVVSHICLHKVIETKHLNTKTFDMAVDGGDQMFAYFNNNTIHRIVSILADAKIYITPEFENEQFVYDLTAGVQVSNFAGNTVQNIYSRFTILNTQTESYIKQTILNKDTKKFKFVKKAEQQVISLGSDWFSGQPVGFWVTCSTCGSNDYSILSNIYAVTDGKDIVYDISDAAQFGTYGQVYQERKALSFQDTDGKFKTRLTLTVSGNCDLIAVANDASFILSSYASTTGTTVGLVVSSCTNGACSQFRQGSAQLGGLNKIAKLRMLDKKNIIILNTDPENFNSVDSLIQVVTFEYDETSFTLSTNLQINDEFVGGKAIKIADFDQIQYQLSGITYTTLVFSDINSGIYFIHLPYDEKGRLAKTTYELLNLRTYTHDQYYLKDDTLFYQVKIIKSEVQGTVIQLTLLITTSNSAHYTFYVELDGSKPTISTPIIKSSTQLQYILTPYATWNAIDKSSWVNGNIVIPYTDQSKVVLAVYDLPSEKTSVVKTIQFQHAVWDNYENVLPIDFALLLVKKDGDKYPTMYANIHYDSVTYNEHLLYKYSLFDGPQLVLTNTTNYSDNVEINLFTYNHFTAAEGKAYLTTNNSNPDDDKSGSSNWWWITLIVIFGVAILGAGGWFAYQKFGKKSVNPLLG